jgi:hypothetical protein
LRIRDVYLGSRIPDPTFFHPSSRIPDPNCLHPGSSSKNLSILTPKTAKKWFLSSKKYDPGCSSRIRMLTFSHPDPGSRIQGSKRYPIPDPGSGSATLQGSETLIFIFSWFYDNLIRDPIFFIVTVPYHTKMTVWCSFI